MRIAICDDDKISAETILRICKNSIGEREYLIFCSGEEFLSCEKGIDLVILDIEMPGLNGIEVKEKLHTLHKDTLIIYVTNHREFVMDAFGIHVLGFIEKGRLNGQLPVMLQTAEQVLDQGTVLDGLYNSRDIAYIKAEHNYGRLVFCKGGTYLMRASMKELEEKLTPCNFLRIHREYLVNMMWIEGIQEKSVCLSGKDLPISVRMRGEVGRKYREYCRKNARYC